MKRFTRLSGTIAGVALASAVLVTTAMAAPPVQQGAAAPTTPGAGLHQGAGLGMRGAPVWAGFEDEVATFLGMTQEQIQAERQAGKSLVQIAQSKGKTEQVLVDTILAAKRADLDKAVADKTITQAQADLIYQHMQTQVPQMVNRTTTGPAFSQGGPAAGSSRLGLQRGRGMGR